MKVHRGLSSFDTAGANPPPDNSTLVVKAMRFYDEQNSQMDPIYNFDDRTFCNRREKCVQN
jgi:hypothetical protein